MSESSPTCTTCGGKGYVFPYPGKRTMRNCTDCKGTGRAVAGPDTPTTTTLADQLETTADDLADLCNDCPEGACRPCIWGREAALLRAAAARLQDLEAERQRLQDECERRWDARQAALYEAGQLAKALRIAGLPTGSETSGN